MVRRSTWAWLGVFVATLGLALWWVRWGPGAQGEAEEGGPEPAPWQVAASDVTALRVELPQEDRAVEVRGQGQEWEVVHPERGPADPFRVSLALSWLETAQVSGQVEPTAGPEAFGLEPPRARIVVGLRDGGLLRLEVGRQAPTGGLTYLRMPGQERLYLVSSSDLELILSLVDPIPLASPTAVPAEEITPEP